MLQSAIETELERRLALLAVATKQYELKHDRWPVEFNDLVDVGIDPTIWSNELQADFQMITTDISVRLDFQEHSHLRVGDREYYERPPAVRVTVR